MIVEAEGEIVAMLVSEAQTGDSGARICAPASVHSTT
jgi:hypothetical protein